MFGFSFYKKSARNRSRHMAWTALMAVFFLVTHALDVCAAHSGVPDLTTPPIATVVHGDSLCSAAPGVACLCTHCACVPLPLESEHHSDGCSSTSELSTRAQTIGFNWQMPLIELPVFAAVPETVEHTDTFVFAFGREGPQPALLLSQYLLSPLPGRAPPIIA